MSATGIETAATDEAGRKASAAAEKDKTSAQAWLPPIVAWYAVGMVSTVAIFAQIDRGIMGLLVQSIKADMHMSDTEISLLMGLAYSLVFMLGGLPMGRVADGHRRTLLLSGALAIWSVGTFLCGLAQNFWQFFVFRGLIGGGEGAKGPVSAALIPDLVRREKLPLAFGIYNMSLIIGEALALVIGGLLLGWLAKHSPIHVPGLGEVHGWQMVYFIFGVPGILLAVFFYLTVPEPARHGGRKKGAAPIKDVLALFRRGPTARFYILMNISGIANSFFALGVGGWRPAFYERTYGLTPHEFGPILGLIGVITAPIGLGIGALAMKFMTKRWEDAPMRLALITQVLAIPLWIFSPLMPTFALAVVCQVIGGVLLMAGGPAMVAAQQMVTPNEMRGQMWAIYMFTVGVIGQSLGPTFVALLTDYLFHAESELRYAMVTAGAITAPIIALCTFFSMKPFVILERKAQERERSAQVLGGH